MVIPFERRVTKQTARKGASRTGFAPRVQRLCCPPCKWSPTFDAACSSPLRPVDAETRLMPIIETASLCPLASANQEPILYSHTAAVESREYAD
jgi:hypothetical protein